MDHLTKTKRDHRLEARVTAAQKLLLEQAAALRCTTVTGFVVAAAEHAAHDVVERERLIRLEQQDIEEFFAVLAKPPKPNRALKAAIAKYEELVETDG